MTRIPPTQRTHPRHAVPPVRAPRRGHGALRAGGALSALLLVAACASGGERPDEGPAFGGVPALAGVRVMVFPVQAQPGVAGDATREMVFALGAAPHVRWLAPDDLRAALRGSPSLDVELTGLPVGVFLQREVRRVGDPLYGVLRRLAALTDGEVAMIPLQVRHRAAEVDPVASAPPGPGHLEVVATLVSPRNGRVFWTGVVAGAPGAADDPAALASAMEALVDRLAPTGESP